MKQSDDAPESPREFLRALVRYHYDLQRLRIMADNRCGKKRKKPKKEDEENPQKKKKKEAPKSKLTPAQKKFFDVTGDDLYRLEGRSLRAVQRECEKWSIYPWLKDCRGIGPASMGVLLSELDITKANRPSSFWKFAGLAVVDGRADRLRQGQKSPYNTWLKSKVLWMGGLFIRCGNKEYGDAYRGDKLRLESTIGPCITCAGTGKAKASKQDDRDQQDENDEQLVRDERDEHGKEKIVTCWNCEGKGNGPKGRSNAHRHQMAIRFAVKMFLADLWTAWRLVEGLPIVGTYGEDKLGHQHGE